MAIKALPGGGEIIAERSDGDHRYRITRTPAGYLVTARSRDAIGAMIVAEWLHRSEEASLACMAAVEAGNVAFRAIMQGMPSEGLLRRYGELIDAHNATCERLDDLPRVGQEVRNLRSGDLE
jgi:hypothetical protein